MTGGECKDRHTCPVLVPSVLLSVPWTIIISCTHRFIVSTTSSYTFRRGLSVPATIPSGIAEDLVGSPSVHRRRRVVAQLLERRQVEYFVRFTIWLMSKTIEIIKFDAMEKSQVCLMGGRWGSRGRQEQKLWKSEDVII